MSRVPWKNLVQHQSQFIRLDEQIRMKQFDLSAYNYAVEGWTKVAAQEILEHQRILYKMRCYIHINCCNIFGQPMMSKNEFENMKLSFRDTDNFLSENEEDETFNLTPSEISLLYEICKDKTNSVNFFKKLLSVLLDFFHDLTMITPKERNQMIEIIFKRCNFIVE